MKKLFVLFVAVAATMSALAASKTVYFNRPQFQKYLDAQADGYNKQLTVPLIYKGTMSTVTDAGITTFDDDCVVDDKEKKTVFMTICQPCIDCYPCEVLQIQASDEPVDSPTTEDEPGFITVWDLYIINEIDKKNKEVYIDVIDMAADSDTFFTGPLKGKALIAAVQDDSAAAIPFLVTGKKSDYKFKFTEAFLSDDLEWVNEGAVSKQTAYIKSIASMDGAFSVYYNAVANGFYFIAGEVKLSRNASLTKKAIETAYGYEGAPKFKNWEDCVDPIEAEYCEEYLSNFDVNYFESDLYKKYDVWFTEYTAFADYKDELAAAFEEEFAAEEDEEKEY